MGSFDLTAIMLIIASASEDDDNNLQTPLYAPAATQEQSLEWRRWNPYSPSNPFISCSSQNESSPPELLPTPEITISRGTPALNSSGLLSLSFETLKLSTPERESSFHFPQSPCPQARVIAGFQVRPLFVPMLPPLPSKVPRPMSEYIELLPISMCHSVLTHQQNHLKLICPSAIIRKYRGQRFIYRPKTGTEFNTSTTMKHLWHDIRDKWISKQELEAQLALYQDIMFASPVVPHPLIQSNYIVLWANVDIYFAMNYVLSPFCQSLDEATIITLLKQMTVFSGYQGTFANLIKASWNGLHHQHSLKRAVLYYGTRNVASFSLMTLAVHDVASDTFIRLFVDAMDAEQRITLKTFNCIVRNLGNIPINFITQNQVMAISIVWGKVVEQLEQNQSSYRERREWVFLMREICDRLRLDDLAANVRAYHARQKR